MAISRPFLLALLGAVLLGATVLAVQNARTASDGDTAPAALQSQPAPAPAENSTAVGPEQTLKSALDLGELDSAKVAAKVTLGNSNESLKLDLSGAFETGKGKAIPDFAVNVRFATGGQKVDGGFVSLGDKAYFVRGDTGWRVPAVVWDPLVGSAATPGASAAGQKLPFTLHPDTWVRDVKSEGKETIGGVETEHVSARVDPQAVVNDLSQAARQNGAELPNADAVGRAVKRAEVDVWVGADDHILRRLSAVLAFAGSGRLEVDVRLSDVNEPQQIEAPAHVRAGAPGGVFGQFAQDLTTGLSGASGAERVSLEALNSPNPRRAARALREHRKVVILFRNPRGLDDRAMTAVMRNVAGRTKALVLTDHVDAVDRYGKPMEDLGVSQTPSVVIIDRSGRARLIQGYVDSDTLTQAVADAR